MSERRSAFEGLANRNSISSDDDDDDDDDGDGSGSDQHFPSAGFGEN